MKKQIEKAEEPKKIKPKKRTDNWTIEIVTYRYGSKEEFFM